MSPRQRESWTWRESWPPPFIDLCVNNATIQRKKGGRSDWRTQPRSCFDDARVRSIERTRSSMRSSRSLGQPLARSCLAKCQTPSSGFSSGVGRETLQAQTRMLAQQLIQRFALMGGGVIHKHHDRAAQVSKQMAEEEAHFLLPDVAEPKLVIEAEMLSLRTDGDSRDHGDSLAPIRMAQDRGLAPRGPGLDHVGDQQEPRFVGEDEVGAQPRSVFFTRGQSFCFQRSMACSSRSSARRSGFWWLQFRLCINRPT